MTCNLRKPTSRLTARPSRAAAARATIVAALIAGFSASASAVTVKLGGHFQESIEACYGGGALTCPLNFSQVPANKQLVVTNAACRISASLATTGFLHVVLGKQKPGGGTHPLAPWSYLKPTLIGSDNSGRVYVADGQILHLYDSGETPRILAYPVQLSGTRIYRLSCTISGTLRNRPGS